jgi:hypothetical protein
MSRLNNFHLLPGVWQEGQFHDQVWAQIRARLKNKDSDLNSSERAVLSELIGRMSARPKARKALGIRLASRTDARNQAIADQYMALRLCRGKTAIQAARAVEKKNSGTGSRTIRAVLESNKYLPLARSRAVAALRFGNTPKQ